MVRCGKKIRVPLVLEVNYLLRVIQGAVSRSWHGLRLLPVRGPHIGTRLMDGGPMHLLCWGWGTVGKVPFFRALAFKRDS